MGCVSGGCVRVEPLWLPPLMGGRWAWPRSLHTNEGNMESVEVSHKQADWMLIVYVALSPSNGEQEFIQVFCSE